MPVFNHADKVIEMIHSIQAGTFTDWELIAIDDGSTDEDFSRISDCIKSDGRIVYERRTAEPKGAPTCRNVGFGKAHGRFICFFDSDDVITEDCLERRVTELEERPELDFMVFRSDVYGYESHGFPNYTDVYGYKVYRNDIKAFCERTLPFVVWNNIYRKSSLERHNIKWDTKLKSLQDAQFNLETLLSGMRYAYSTSPANYKYRISTESSISKKICSEEHLDSNIYAVESFYNLIQGNFGIRYDTALYRGAMAVNLRVAREHFYPDFSKRLAEVIRRHSILYGTIFTLQIFITKIFIKILPYRIARQIPMFPYLLRKRILIKICLPRRIRKLAI